MTHCMGVGIEGGRTDPRPPTPDLFFAWWGVGVGLGVVGGGDFLSGDFFYEKSAITVYKSMILPFYDYCDVIYSFSTIPEIKTLDRQHLGGMRICLDNGYDMNDNELFVNCKLSSLENRRKVHTRNYLFNKKDLCERDTNINTRLHDGPVFKVIHPNVETVKRSIWYGGSLEWNSLDADNFIRNIKEHIHFKRVQKSWMLNTYVY